MEFAVLGSIEVISGRGQVTLGGRKQRLVLATLLHHAGRPVPQHTLVEALWGDSPPRTAADNLRLYIYQLRRALGPKRIERRGSGYVLTVEPGELDVHRFGSLGREGRDALAAGEHERAAELLRQALALWRGRPYSDLDDRPELRDEALRLSEERLALLESRFEAELALGRDAELVAELGVTVREQPFRERLRAQLMVALDRSGRQAEALAVYSEGRRISSQELGLPPGPELRELHQTILTGRPARETPAAAKRGVPAQLPPDIADFTGRGGHIGDLTALLDRSSAAHKPLRTGEPLVVSVIAGMGGIGKTALAVHTAHRLTGAYSDGQLYVNLRGAEARPADPGTVLTRFLTALGVPGPTIPESLEERAALYRSHLAHRKILVVLDNAASEQQVRPLLPGAPSCAVLLTSRARLTGLEGARTIDLGVLDPWQASELLKRIVGAARVKAEPRAAAKITKLCGHIPLAVRIAGARLAARPHWSLASFAAQLSDEHGRLDQLAAGDLEVRASFALSYLGLPERGQRLFRRLGLLNAPDFASWVAGALLDCDYAEGTEELEALVDAQLVTVAGVDATGQVRYRFHDLLRLYAREQAGLADDRQEREEALARAFGMWLALSGRAMEGIPAACYAIIHGPAMPESVPERPASVLLEDPVAWFDSERAALRAAIAQSCELMWPDLAWDLAGCLERYLDTRGLFEECRRTNVQVMEVCRATGNLLGEAVMLRGLLDVTTWMGSGYEGGGMGTMRSGGERLAEMFTRIGDKRGLSDAYAMGAWGLAATGEVEAALDAARTALTLAGETGHIGGQARAHLAIAVAYGERRAHDTIPHLARALELAHELGNRRFQSTVHQFFGLAHCVIGDYSEAHHHLSRSLELKGDLHDPSSETMVMAVLAKVYALQGDPRARPVADSAAALGRQYNLGHHLADALWLIGRLDLAEGRPDDALKRMTESVAIWRARGWKSYLAGALITLGEAHAAAGDPEAARTAWREAVALSEEAGDATGARAATEAIEGLSEPSA
ncbi:AfsR/SARP family transcriptional regulator [Sinosporangium siamense]|uniref:SARP family transcriptional regulator n=1 Tax=Sinosporangium siamense TaxID=1367973 RepID=A0A919RKQ8_9ACTN|nr:AfsR/SARP family transcriptional regulator [Sinosporangium siamense]GII95393.1 SARP family transcriptional regulator [Sinosporangium siamense]